MRSVDGKTLLEFLVLCCFEIVVVIAILMVVGVLPWPSLPAELKEPPPLVSQRNAPEPAPAATPAPASRYTAAPALEPAALEPAPEPAPEPVGPVPEPVE